MRTVRKCVIASSKLDVKGNSFTYTSDGSLEDAVSVDESGTSDTLTEVTRALSEEEEDDDDDDDGEEGEVDEGGELSPGTEHDAVKPLMDDEVGESLLLFCTMRMLLPACPAMHLLTRAYIRSYCEGKRWSESINGIPSTLF